MGSPKTITKKTMQIIFEVFQLAANISYFPPKSITKFLKTLFPEKNE